MNQPEYITEITGEPKKVYRKRKRRNPLYQRPKPAKLSAPVWQKELVFELRRARLAQGLSQLTIARSLNTHQSIISKFENAQLNSTAGFFEQYAQTVGKKINVTVK